MTTPSTWPYLSAHAGDALRRVSLPLGGIGTGTIGLSGNGRLVDWEIEDHPHHGNFPSVAHVVARVNDGETVRLVALEGPLDDSEADGPSGSRAQNHGLPRFTSARFHAAYPLGRIELEDIDLPIIARLEAFNPLVPGDSGASSLPVAMLRYTITNTTDRPLEVTVCASIANPLDAPGAQSSITPQIHPDHAALLYTTTGLAHRSGTFAIAMPTAGADDSVSWRTGWPDLPFGDSRLDFWDDLAEDGQLSERSGEGLRPTGSLALMRTIPAGGSMAFPILLGWHLPRRRAWKWLPQSVGDSWSYDDDELLGNHYALPYRDAAEVAASVLERWKGLEARTLAFVSAFASQSVPTPVLEAALASVSVLRSQTVFRTADGHLFGWEGCADLIGSCHGNCTHVWHYEYATSHLFGDLAASMRELEFLHATDERGKMSFRIGLPLAKNARQWPFAAADGQTGAIVRLLHDWRLRGDDEWLATIWPAARRALEFCWIDGGWDADRDGVMEGVQHNTYDVEFYGPSPQMQTWYLAALDAAAIMARRLGEIEFAGECERLLVSGRQETDRLLFNGEYYRQDIRPLQRGATVAEGLRRPTETDEIGWDPVSQLGDGCLVDQLVGNVAARLAGLGDQLAPENIRRSAKAVFAHNSRDRADRTHNHLRSYALGDESSLVICSFPRGGRPARPFPYFSESMTGFEYTAATALVQAGARDAALKVVTDVRTRFDGRRRNPFDEMEAGRHYARSMASWGTLLAWQGVRLDAVEASVTWDDAVDGATLVWSNGFSWGAVSRSGDEVALAVHEGDLRVSRIDVPGLGSWSAEEQVVVRPDAPLVAVLR